MHACSGVEFRRRSVESGWWSAATQMACTGAPGACDASMLASECVRFLMQMDACGHVQAHKNAPKYVQPHACMNVFAFHTCMYTSAAGCAHVPAHLIHAHIKRACTHARMHACHAIRHTSTYAFRTGAPTTRSSTRG
eukprot:6198238-Pleurochrysis_carterae.AAC.1